MSTIIFSFLLFTTALFGQERPLMTENPLTQFRDEVRDVLAKAELPFTDEQERAIAPMMEERFANNEPSYQDRQTSFDIGGPNIL